MKSIKASTSSSEPAFRQRVAICLLALAAAVYTVSCALAQGDDKKHADPKPGGTNAPAANAAAAKPAEAPKKKAAAKPLTGAELYSMHCNRCHPERYPTERTAAQWKTIALHMQVRANIPPAQVKKILSYLQENSGR